MMTAEKLLMKIRKIPARLLQKWHGLLADLHHQISLVLTERYWLIDYFPKKKAAREAVLLVRLDLIGDFVIWLDAAKEFKSLYPDKHVVLYANQAWANLAERFPYWDEVVKIDVPRLRSNEHYRLRFLFETRIRGFSVAIHPTYSREYVADLIIRATAAPHRIAHHGDLNNITPEKKVITDSWYTKLVPDVIYPAVELNINAELVRALGKNNFRSAIPVIGKLADLPRAFEVISQYCVLVPGASWRPRMWPIEYFAKVAQQLTKKNSLKIVLCGTTSERSLCEQITSLSGLDTLNLAGETTLIEMIEIIRNATLIIANESSAIHIAAATSVPAICVMGGGHFGRFLPYQAEVIDIVRPQPVLLFEQMACYGCRWSCIHTLAPDESVPCIARVEVAQVLKACALFE
jgi:ADP-heptose:LPS heptosyltransferase